ncbi:MAG: hypothetical protein ACM3VZ_14730 [Acidobacteriota bacterium]
MPLAWVLAVVAAPSAAQTAPTPLAWGAYAEAELEAWSNGVPIVDINGNWSHGYERRSGTQRAYVMGRAEAGAKLKVDGADASRTWRLGLLHRADASARLSGEAAQVLYHYQSKTDPSEPVTYNADTDILFWQGRGLALHTPSLNWLGLQFHLGWDVLKLQRMRSLQSRGQVGYNADDSYSYLGRVRDDSSRTTEPFMAAPAHQGLGQAVSVAMQWQRPAGSEAGVEALWWPDRVHVKVDDAWSRLSWSGINGDDAVLNSNVMQRTSDGHIEYRAAINGVYTRRTLVERIPVSAQMQLDWTRAEGVWSWRSRNRLGLWQNWLGWQSLSPWQWALAVEPFAGAVQVGVSKGGFKLSVMTDRLDSAAHVRGGQVSWSWPLGW